MATTQAAPRSSRFFPLGMLWVFMGLMGLIGFIDVSLPSLRALYHIRREKQEKGANR
jgi:hypothetical protein